MFFAKSTLRIVDFFNLFPKYKPIQIPLKLHWCGAHTAKSFHPSFIPVIHGIHVCFNDFPLAHARIEEWASEHVGQTSPNRLMIEVDHTQGPFYFTQERKRYYDLIAGISVNNVGHGNPEVIAAGQEQVKRYMHIMVYDETIEAPQVQYAIKIVELLPPPHNSVYFVNSGSEAEEEALKLAKLYTGRFKVTFMHNPYHGSTQGSLSIMGSPEGDQWQQPFQPLLPQVEEKRRKKHFCELYHNDLSGCYSKR